MFAALISARPVEEEEPGRAEAMRWSEVAESEIYGRRPAEDEFSVAPIRDAPRRAPFPIVFVAFFPR